MDCIPFRKTQNETCLNETCDPDSLKSVGLLPEAFQRIFEFRYFNSVQSESFQDAYLSAYNLIISAPTGSGKTVLFELCILQLLAKCLAPDGKLNYSPGSLKTVYVAPLKALVQEKLREWNKKFGQVLNLKCQELTGDTEFFNIRDLQEVDIILTTPEKFDSITRHYRDSGGLSFFGDIALLLIDEVHLLSDPRGAALEAVISRMKMLSRYPEMSSCPLSKIRFVAVSATIPNMDDLAEWLMVPKEGSKRFGEEVRPVKLTTKVFGYAPAKNDFLFERRLQGFLFDILMQHSNGKAALVFCSTRKGAQEAALTLAATVTKLGLNNPFLHSYEQYERLQIAAMSSNDKHMQACIKSAVGYHNGGLGISDRTLVEGLFSNGDLQVLCTTNTLAHGVNLPAHTVIIKSTQYFNKEKGGYVEYDRGSILQMCGRAGRPQFDDSGIAIIMTRRETVHLYENLLSGCEPVESELFPSIAEHLNAEIVLRTVTDVSLAIDWLKCSFLYVRIKKNPERYKIQYGGSIEQLEKKLKDICLQNVIELSKYGLVRTDEDGYILSPLEPGRLMAKYYVCFETMKLIVQSTSNSGSNLDDLVHILSQAQEFKWIKLRRTEKKLLNDINNDTSGRVRFHILTSNGKIKKRIQSAEEKIFVLINDTLSGEPSALDFTLNQDVNGICSNGKRIAKCMSDCYIFMKRFKESINALNLSKCLHQRLWEDSPYQLKQLGGVGMVTAKSLLHVGINSFAKLRSTDPRRLEALTGRKYPFGNHVKDSLDALPPTVDMMFLDAKQGNDQTLQLTRTSQPKQHNKRHYADLIVGSVHDNHILFHERIRLEQFASPYEISIHSTGLHSAQEIVAILISEEYVGVDSTIKFSPNKKVKQKSIRNEKVHEEMELPPKGSDLKSRMQKEKECIKRCSRDHSDVLGQLEESSAVGSFWGPSFNLLPEDCDKPYGEVCDDGRISLDECERNAEVYLQVLESDTGSLRMTEPTRINVFDHIRKRSRRFQALPSVTSTPVNCRFNNMEDATEICSVKSAKSCLGTKGFPVPKAVDQVPNLHSEEYITLSSGHERIFKEPLKQPAPLRTFLNTGFPSIMVKDHSTKTVAQKEEITNFMGCKSVFDFL